MERKITDLQNFVAEKSGESFIKYIRSNMDKNSIATNITQTHKSDIPQCKPIYEIGNISNLGVNVSIVYFPILPIALLAIPKPIDNISTIFIARNIQPNIIV